MSGFVTVSNLMRNIHEELKRFARPRADPAGRAALGVRPRQVTVRAAENNNAAALKIGYSDGLGGWRSASRRASSRRPGRCGPRLFRRYKIIDAYSGDKLDAIAIMCGDSWRRSRRPLSFDGFSEGNDMIIGKPGINSIKDLKGNRWPRRKSGRAPSPAGSTEAKRMDEKDVTIKKMLTKDTVGAWEGRGR